MTELPTPDDARTRVVPLAHPREATAADVRHVNDVRDRLQRSRGQRNAGVLTALIGAVSLIPTRAAAGTVVDIALGSSHLALTAPQLVGAVVIAAGITLGVVGQFLERREVATALRDPLTARAVHSRWGDDEAAEETLGPVNRHWWRAVMGNAGSGEWGWIAPAAITCSFVAIRLAGMWQRSGGDEERVLRASLQSVAATAVVDYARVGAIPTNPERYHRPPPGYALNITLLENRGVLFELSAPSGPSCRITIWPVTPTQANAEHTLCGTTPMPDGSVVIR